MKNHIIKASKSTDTHCTQVNLTDPQHISCNPYGLASTKDCDSRVESPLAASPAVMMSSILVNRHTDRRHSNSNSIYMYCIWTAQQLCLAKHKKCKAPKTWNLEHFANRWCSKNNEWHKNHVLQIQNWCFFNWMHRKGLLLEISSKMNAKFWLNTCQICVCAYFWTLQDLLGVHNKSTF